MGGKRVTLGEGMGGMASLLTNLTSGAKEAQGSRSFMEFTIPERAVSKDFFAAGFTAEHLVIQIVELTPEEENRAIAAAGQGMKFQESFAECVKASIYKIGGVKPTYDQKQNWIKALGAQRKLLDSAYSEVNGIKPDVGEEFLASAKSGRG